MDLVLLVAVLALTAPSAGSAFVAFAAPILSIGFSLIHWRDEVFSDSGPLWEDFGRIARVHVPGWLGFIGFSALAVALGWLAWYGYAGGSMVALSLLLGARLGDLWFSHVDLWLKNLSPSNPGLMSALVLYTAEAAFLIAVFGSALSLPLVLIGAGAFAVVIPLLSAAGRFSRAARRAVSRA